MSDTRGEGCGIWPLLLKGGYFDDECAWHDAAYSVGSWHEDNMPRAGADAWFRDMMLRKAKGNLYRTLQAHLFYGIARAAGFVWWEGKK